MSGLKHGKVKQCPWIRAYREGIDNKNAGVFATYRTKIRESKFKWVGPLVSTKWVIVVLADSDIGPLKNINQARSFETIGGYPQDAPTGFLIDKKFENIEMAKNNTQNMLKLKNHRIQALVTSIPLAYSLAKANDTKIKIIYKIMDMPMYLALHKEMDDEIVNKLQRSVDQMRAKGELDTILTKWGLVHE